MARMKGKPAKAKHFWPTTWRLLSYLKPWRLGVITSVILAIVSVILNTIAPKVLGEATTVLYDGVMKGMREAKLGMHITQYPIDMNRIVQISMQVVVIFVISGLFSLGQQILMTRISQRAVYNLRRDYKHKLARLPIKAYDQHSNGDLMSRMVNDMDNIAGTLQQGLIQVVTSILTFVGVLAMMISISWKLTLVALITIPLSLLVVGFVAPAAQKLFAQQQATLGKLNDQVEEVYAGHTIVRTFNKEGDEAATFAKQNAQYYQVAWKAQALSILMFPLMAFVRNLGYLMIAVMGALEVAHGQITLGNVQAFLQYSNQFSQPITQIANLSSTIQQTIASAERIFEILDEPEMDQTVVETTTLPAPQPKMAFEHVNFSYDDQPLIQDFNLQVQPGEMVAIVGPTGAGKTTIINLLERFYDVQGGTIYLDGVNTRAMTRHDLRQRIAMVLQDTWLFTGTIFDNIKYGRLSATDEEVYAAAKAAHADQFIRQLPQGYDTVLDESASNISQGQRQLLTIARAFLADPEILILDEATSSVDTRTEVLIQKAMQNLQATRTSFVVAHRLSTIRDADQIVVLEHGQIAEIGNHHTLMERNGVYADLYNSQFNQSA